MASDGADPMTEKQNERTEEPVGMTPQERARRNRPYRSSRRRSYVVLGFLALNVGWGIAAASVGFGGEAALDPSLIKALLDLQPILFLTTGISWVVWQHRLSANLWPLGRTLGHTPDAIGWWFVPLLDLLWPFLVMRELWKATGPGENWKRRRLPLVVWVWWGAWVALQVWRWAVAYGRYLREDVPSLMAWAGVATVVGAGCAISMIRSMESRIGDLASMDPSAGSA
jgi:hypothetical protein